MEVFNYSASANDGVIRLLDGFLLASDNEGFGNRLDGNATMDTAVTWDYPLNVSDGNVTYATGIPTGFALWQIIILGSLAGLTSVVTIVGNVVVLMSFVLERTIRQPTNYFIASLACSDLLIGSVSMPFYTIYLLSDKNWYLGEILCDLWLSVDYMVCMTSIYTVFCITIDRYCMVKIPAKYRNWRTERTVLTMVAVTWVVPMVVFFTSIFGWQHFSDAGRTVPESSCYVQYLEHALFNCILQIGYFWISLVVMITLYQGIYRVALSLQQKKDDRHKKMTSLVSMAGQTMTQIGIGMSHQAAAKIPPAKEVKQAKAKDCLGGGYPGVSNTTSFSSSSKAKDKDDERSSSPAFPSDTEPSSTKRDSPPPRPKKLSFGAAKKAANKKNSVVTNTKHSQCNDVVNMNSRNNHSGVNNDTTAAPSKGGDIHRVTSECANGSELKASLHKSADLLTVDCPTGDISHMSSTSSGDMKARSVNVSPVHTPFNGTNNADLRFIDQDSFKSKHSTDDEGAWPKAMSPVWKRRTPSPGSGDHNKGSNRSSRVMDDRQCRDNGHGVSPPPVALKVELSGATTVCALASPGDACLSPTGTPVLGQQEADAGARNSSLRALFRQSRMSRKRAKKEKAHALQSKTENRARKALRTITIILGAFVFCWTPWHILSMISGFYPTNAIVTGVLYDISYWLCYLNSPINPFCYALANQQFKKTFARIIRLDWRRT